jgi:hypothetical protein
LAQAEPLTQVQTVGAFQVLIQHFLQLPLLVVVVVESLIPTTDSMVVLAVDKVGAMVHQEAEQRVKATQVVQAQTVDTVTAQAVVAVQEALAILLAHLTVEMD